MHTAHSCWSRGAKHMHICKFGVSRSYLFWLSFCFFALTRQLLLVYRSERPCATDVGVVNGWWRREVSEVTASGQRGSLILVYSFRWWLDWAYAGRVRTTLTALTSARVCCLLLPQYCACLYCCCGCGCCYPTDATAFKLKPSALRVFAQEMLCGQMKSPNRTSSLMPLRECWLLKNIFIMINLFLVNSQLARSGLFRPPDLNREHLIHSYVAGRSSIVPWQLTIIPIENAHL